jgi:hypothetical protein
MERVFHAGGSAICAPRVHDLLIPVEMKRCSGRNGFFSCFIMLKKFLAAQNNALGALTEN